MQNNTKLCDHCGAICDINDTYCKKCSHTFSKDSINSPVIDGIDNAELKQFLGKNSDYYLKKFAKARNKKTFLQLNIPALLFGTTWFFYRKMYKFAVLYTSILIIASSVLSAVIPMLFKSDIDAFYSARAEYADYVNSGGETHIFGENSSDMQKHPVYEALRDRLENCQKKLRIISFLINAPVFIANIFFRLLANSFYKKHILSSIKNENGGTSGKAAFWGFILVDVAITIISFLLLQIPVVFSFQNALENTIPFWLY